MQNITTEQKSLRNITAIGNITEKTTIEKTTIEKQL